MHLFSEASLVVVARRCPLVLDTLRVEVFVSFLADECGFVISPHYAHRHLARGLVDDELADLGVVQARSFAQLLVQQCSPL